MTMRESLAAGCSWLFLYRPNHFGLCNDALRWEHFCCHMSMCFNAIDSCNLLCMKLISPEVKHSAHTVITVSGSGCCIN